MARYIDVEELTNRLVYCYEHTPEESREHYAYGVVLREIDSIPISDVEEVRHGEWVTLEAEIGLYSCSLCEHKILRAECNYCPNCGAKMDGGNTE